MSFEDFGTEMLQLVGSLRTDVKLKESTDQQCVVCGEIQNQWDCYQLPCLHYGHTRCLRKWINTKKEIYCPWCRDNTPQKKYCEECQTWGDHSDFEPNKCPDYIHFLKEEENDYLKGFFTDNYLLFRPKSNRK